MTLAVIQIHDVVHTHQGADVGSLEPLSVHSTCKCLTASPTLAATCNKVIFKQSDCMSATLAATCDKVIFKQSDCMSATLAATCDKVIFKQSDCMSATSAATCDKVIYKQSAQTARRATWCIYRRGDAPLGMVVCTNSRVFVLEK